MQLGFTGARRARTATTTSRAGSLGVDLRFTYRPPEAGTRQGHHLRAEGYRLQRDGLGPTTNRYGMYSDLSWQAQPALGARRPVRLRGGALRAGGRHRWRVTAVRHLVAERVRLPAPAGDTATDLESTGSPTTCTLQVVWAMGPHKHETY